MDRVEAIRSSLFVFVCGLLAFIPVLGVAAAVLAIAQWMRVCRGYSGWNPAASYLQWGATFAFLGLLESFVATLLISYVLLT